MPGTQHAFFKAQNFLRDFFDTRKASNKKNLNNSSVARQTRSLLVLSNLLWVLSLFKKTKESFVIFFFYEEKTEIPWFLLQFAQLYPIRSSIQVFLLTSLLLDFVIFIDSKVPNSHFRNVKFRISNYSFSRSCIWRLRCDLVHFRLSFWSFRVCLCLITKTVQLEAVKLVTVSQGY